MAEALLEGTVIDSVFLQAFHMDLHEKTSSGRCRKIDMAPSSWLEIHVGLPLAGPLDQSSSVEKSSGAVRQNASRPLLAAQRHCGFNCETLRGQTSYGPWHTW